MPNTEMASPNDVGDSSSSGSDAKSSSERDGSSGRDILRKGFVTARVENARPAAKAVERVAEEYGGYLLESSDVRATIRVPSADFQQAFEAVLKLESLGEILERRIKARDVTDQLRDYEIRIENKRAALKRYRSLLDKTEQVSEMLEIEEEIGRLTGELERLEGERRALKERVSMSKIQVRFRTVDDDGPSEDPLTSFAPQFEYGLGSLGIDDPTLVQTLSIEVTWISVRDLRSTDNPAQYRIFGGMQLLHPTDASNPWLAWSFGFDTTIESAPGRRWLLPFFGFEAGQLFAADRTVAHLTPSAGLHLWSAADFHVSAQLNYVVPPIALQSLRGWRADLGVGFTFW